MDPISWLYQNDEGDKYMIFKEDNIHASRIISAQIVTFFSFFFSFNQN